MEDETKKCRAEIINLFDPIKKKNSKGEKILYAIDKENGFIIIGYSDIDLNNTSIEDVEYLIFDNCIEVPKESVIKPKKMSDEMIKKVYSDITEKYKSSNNTIRIGSICLEAATIWKLKGEIKKSEIIKKPKPSRQEKSLFAVCLLEDIYVGYTSNDLINKKYNPIILSQAREFPKVNFSGRSIEEKIKKAYLECRESVFTARIKYGFEEPIIWEL